MTAITGPGPGPPGADPVTAAPAVAAHVGRTVLVADEGLKGGRTALAAVRALAQAGFEPTITVSGDATLASRSRHAARVVQVPPSDSADWPDAIREEAASGGYLAVFPTSDAAVCALDAPAKDLVDKRILGRAAGAADLSMPSELAFGSMAEIKDVAGLLPLPIALKTAVSAPHETDLSVRVNSVEELEALPDIPGGVIVQPYLDGPMYAVSGVVRQGRLLAAAHQSYVRIWRPEAGVASAARTTEPDLGLEDRLMRLLADHEGVFQAQFIGSHLIDVNPRVYGSLPLAVAAGANLPAIWCRALAGAPPASIVRARPGVYYRWLDADLRAIVAGLRARRLGAGAAVRALRPRRGTVHSIESRRDLRPVLARLADLSWNR